LRNVCSSARDAASYRLRGKPPGTAEVSGALNVAEIFRSPGAGWKAEAFRYKLCEKSSCSLGIIHYTGSVNAKIKILTLLFAAILLLAGCSTKITAPVESRWQVVPCEYKLTGDDQSTLQVRALVADFDSALIVAHTFHWTVYGDTLSRETTLFPREHEKAKVYTIFTADRSLPINSVLRSVELFIKN
jgi:hypothetical protein